MMQAPIESENEDSEEEDSDEVLSYFKGFYRLR